MYSVLTPPPGRLRDAAVMCWSRLPNCVSKWHHRLKMAAPASGLTQIFPSFSGTFCLCCRRSRFQANRITITNRRTQPKPGQMKSSLQQQRRLLDRIIMHSKWTEATLRVQTFNLIRFPWRHPLWFRHQYRDFTFILCNYYFSNKAKLYYY